MASRLRLGVLGVGGRWPRFRDAARALRDELRVRAVWDECPARAEQEAARLGCRAVGGAVELLERDDVDAVLLPGGAWAGTWALERACAAGKPALCAVSPLADEERFAALAARAGPSAKVQVALWPALEVLAEAAAERVREGLGPPALVRAGLVRAGEAADVLRAPAALALLAVGAGYFDGAPRAVTAVQPAPGFATVVLELEQGVVQVSLFAGPAGSNACELQVEAEDGGLRAALPRRLSWAGAEGHSALALPAVPAEALVLDRFVQAAREGALSGEGLARAARALGWLRAARRSAAEGRRVELAGPC